MSRLNCRDPSRQILCFSYGTRGMITDECRFVNDGGCQLPRRRFPAGTQLIGLDDWTLSTLGLNCAIVQAKEIVSWTPSTPKSSKEIDSDLVARNKVCRVIVPWQYLWVHLKGSPTQDIGGGPPSSVVLSSGNGRGLTEGIPLGHIVPDPDLG